MRPIIRKCLAQRDYLMLLGIPSAGLTGKSKTKDGYIFRKAKAVGRSRRIARFHAQKRSVDRVFAKRCQRAYDLHEKLGKQSAAAYASLSLPYF